MTEVTGTDTSARTVEQVIEAAMGEEIDARNWKPEGPSTFDDTVYEAAVRTRQGMTTTELSVLYKYVGDCLPFRQTLGEVCGRDHGDVFVAMLLVAMYWRTET